MCVCSLCPSCADRRLFLCVVSAAAVQAPSLTALLVSVGLLLIGGLIIIAVGQYYLLKRDPSALPADPMERSVGRADARHIGSHDCG
jgi:hypothetical protein